MLLEEFLLNCDRPTAKLVIVCHEADKEGTRSALNAEAPLNWEADGDIRLLEVGTRVQHRATRRKVLWDLDRVRRALDAIAPKLDAAKIIVVANSDVRVESAPADLRTIQHFSSVAEFRSYLSPLLKSQRLDWQNRLFDELGHYQVSVSQSDVVTWTSQFAELGMHDWIPRGLLKLLDFWPAHRLSNTLLQASSEAREEKAIIAWLEEYDVVATHEAATGSSSAVVLRIAKTQMGRTLRARRENFLSQIRSSTPSRILFLEDCCLTGHETIELLKKAKEEPNFLKHTIDLKFAAGTESARCRVDLYIEKNELQNVRFIGAEDFIANLSETGELAHSSGTLFDSSLELVNTRNNIIDDLTLRAGLLFNGQQRKELRYAGRSICRPLLEGWMRERGQFEKLGHYLDDWTLGYQGLGMMLIFAHGVPKPCLPLFWMSGKISVEYLGRRKSVNWRPLFPEPFQRQAEILSP